MLYNSVSMVALIFSQFFFVMVLNKIFVGCPLYCKLPIRMSRILWIATSLFHTLVAELAMAGYIRAYEED